MTDLTNTVGQVIGIGTIVGGVITWIIKTKRDARKLELDKILAENERLKMESEQRRALLEEVEMERKSVDMLYEQMEELKKKVILAVAKEVELATTVAEKDMLITGLRNHCQDCYNSYMEQFESR